MNVQELSPSSGALPLPTSTIAGVFYVPARMGGTDISANHGNQAAAYLALNRRAVTSADERTV
jgi:hypothetical protein